MKKMAAKNAPRRVRSEAVQKALDVLNKELLFVVQSRDLDQAGNGVGIWYTHKTLGDWKNDGTIQGKARAYEKMEEAKDDYPPRQWRVVQRDNVVYYQEGVRDKMRQAYRLSRRPAPQLAMPALMAGREM